MTRIAAAPPMMRAMAPVRTLEARTAALGLLQAASHASLPTSQPVGAVPKSPGEAQARRVPAHILDIRV